METFSNFISEIEIKRTYRRLVFKYHPDQGGTKEEMQALNAAYHAALKRVNGNTSTHNDATFTYRYDENLEREIADKLAELIALRMQEVTIELIGTWLWIHGQTKPHKDQIKALGCKWHAQKEAWFFHVGKWHKGRGRGSLAELAGKYGSSKFKAPEHEKIN